MRIGFEGPAAGLHVLIALLARSGINVTVDTPPGLALGGDSTVHLVLVVDADLVNAVDRELITRRVRRCHRHLERDGIHVTVTLLD